VTGNSELGTVRRDLRKLRHLTLAAVARHAGCAESLISYVESGGRQLHPWLAAKLDDLYCTGGVVAALMRGTYGHTHNTSGSGAPQSEILMVELPGGGAPMPLSRRELLATLSIGIAGSALHSEFERALDSVPINGDTLQLFENAYAGFRTAARTLPPSQLLDGLIGHVAVLDGLRRRASGSDRPRYSHLQARYAETLSWFSEEAGSLSGAMYWIDRASQWGQAANWHAMSAYSFIRRSMVVVRFSGDGLRAVDHARAAFEMPDVSPRMKGLAAKGIAIGYALNGDEPASSRALDDAMRLLSMPVREDDAVLGPRSVVNDDLFAIYRATCDICLGRGERVVSVLESHLDSLSASSARWAIITQAKLARAYANAGQPEEAAKLSLAALDDIDRIGSFSARIELKRALPVLRQWHGRDDVQAVILRLTTTNA
jgi:hypothetical protein